MINVWYTSNGERLGTFGGHNGSVWTVACDCELLSLRIGAGLESGGGVVGGDKGRDTRDEVVLPLVTSG